jgi:hypothetical protein
MANIKLKKIIGNNAHWTLNKSLVKQLGLTETLVLQHIIDLSESAFKKNEIWQPIHEMADELCISEYAVKQAVGKLKSVGLICVERKSVGYMNFYSVNGDRVMEFISGSGQLTSELKSTHQSVDGVNNSLVDTKSTHSDTEINSLVDTKSTLGEVNTNSQSVENYSAITNNTRNNPGEIIETNNTTKRTGNIVNIIDKLLTELIDTEDTKRSYNAALELMNNFDYDELQKIMNWDSDVRKNWERQITTTLKSY